MEVWENWPFVFLQSPCLAGGHTDYSWHVLPKCLSDPPKLLLCSLRCCRILNPEPSSQREMPSDLLFMVGASQSFFVYFLFCGCVRWFWDIKWQNPQSANKWPLQIQQSGFAFLPSTRPPITLETELKPWVMKKGNTIGALQPTKGKALPLLFCPSWPLPGNLGILGRSRDSSPFLLFLLEYLT